MKYKTGSATLQKNNDKRILLFHCKTLIIGLLLSTLLSISL